MFFGRRKHAAPAPARPAPAVPEFTDEMIFAAVQRTLQGVFGDDGEWTVARRGDAQTDRIFHEVLVNSLATSVTASVSAARPADDLLAGGPFGLLRAPRANLGANGAAVGVAGVDGAGVDGIRLGDTELDDTGRDDTAFDDAATMAVDVDGEPAAFSWEPAPITRWADLRRPVTGPVAIVDGTATASEEKAA